jgi:two-component system, NarL family, response regulator LiaR
MDRRIITYGIALALMMTCIKMLEYKLVIVDRLLELYGGALAVIFTIIGILAGRKLTAGKEVVVEQIITVPVAPVNPVFETDHKASEKIRLSKREFEILGLMAEGLSNQEIADKIFVSVSTVKTHGANLFVKLDVQRRTQAVKKAKELKLIP